MIAYEEGNLIQLFFAKFEESQMTILILINKITYNGSVEESRKK